MSKELASDQKEHIKRRETPDKGLAKEQPTGPGSRVAAILHLQRLVGNGAVQRLLASHTGAGLAQRQGGEEGFSLDDETADRINQARGGGQALDSTLQKQMGEGMGHDFSGVRVHTGPESHDLNRQLSAKAFTTGQDIFFRQGAYDPGSSAGQELVAHELSHVVQQSTGRVGGSSGGMTVRPAGDAYEQEADSIAKTATSASLQVQRQEELPEEELQTRALQRQEVPEEEELQTRALQRQEVPEEELQTAALQRQEVPEEEEIQTAALQHQEEVPEEEV